MDSVKISCSINTTDAACPMGLEIWLDEDKILDEQHVTHALEFSHDMRDDEAQHELRFVLKNKPWDYTKIDQHGNIVQDALLEISNIAFDEIELGYLATEQSTYTHDLNGTGQQQNTKFFGQLGCNGTVSFKFNTPIYLWLLEHM